MPTKSLWGPLPATEGIRTPTQVLKEQATALANMTGSVLQGEVNVTQNRGVFELDLNIVVPALDNYRYLVARATHRLDLYPVTLMPGWELYNQRVTVECPDEGAFEAALGEILSSEKVRRVLTSLLAQSRAM